MAIIRGHKRAIYVARMAHELSQDNQPESVAVNILREAAGNDVDVLSAAIRLCETTRPGATGLELLRAATAAQATPCGLQEEEWDNSKYGWASPLKSISFADLAAAEPKLQELESQVRAWRKARCEEPIPPGNRLQVLHARLSRNEYVMYRRIRRGVGRLVGPHSNSDDPALRSGTAYTVALAHLAHIAGFIPDGP